jgi:cell shape-determining protein MreC
VRYLVFITYLQIKKERVKQMSKEKYEGLLKLIFGVLIVVVLCWFCFIIVNAIKDHNQYVVNLELEVRELQTREDEQVDYLDDLLDLYAELLETKAEVEFYEENSVLLKSHYQLRAENEFLEEHLEFMEEYYQMKAENEFLIEWLKYESESE